MKKVIEVKNNQGYCNILINKFKYSQEVQICCFRLRDFADFNKLPSVLLTKENPDNINFTIIETYIPFKEYIQQVIKEVS